jgi:hypothetical protein
VLAMLEIHAHPGSGSAIGTELVGDHHARRAGLLADELAQELLRCAPALTALNQSVKNEAVSIDGLCCTKNSSCNKVTLYCRVDEVSTNIGYLRARFKRS